MNTSQFVAKYLEKKIKKIFTVTGGGMMFLTEALFKSKIQMIFNHHEQSSIFATDALARVSGKTQVCFATSGPGITNCITGILSAWQDSTPLIIIAGQSKTRETIQFFKSNNLRQHGTFEANAIEILKPITKFTKQITNPDSIKYYLDKAFYVSNDSRPGPVYLEIPLDVQSSKINIDKIKRFKKFIPKKQSPNKINLRLIEKHLKKATRPIILLGNGINVSNSASKARQIIKKLKIPTLTTQLAKGSIDYKNKFFVGHTGPKGDRAGNLAVQKCDLIIVLGSSLHSQTIGWEHNNFSPKSFKIQIDPDKTILKKNKFIDLKINADLKFAINKLQKIVLKKNFNAWHKKCSYWKKRYQVILEPHKRQGKLLNFYDIVHNISLLIPEKSTIISDAGAAFYIMGQTFRTKKNQKYLIPGSLGQMGYAIPASSGASAYSNKNVFCLTGDGSMMTNFHELSVIKKNNFNIKIFLINNHGYMSIRNSQRDFFGGSIHGTDKETGINIPNIYKTAKFFGIKYHKCLTISDIKRNFLIEKNYNRPAIFDCHSMRDQEIIPSVKSKVIKGKLVAQNLENMYPYNH